MQDGALKLTDFGFAKYIKYRSWTLCGTPEYLAPELILEKGHGKAVDYWAFGVLFFEMLNGHSPFEAEDHLATYQKILDGTVNYPAKMNAQVRQNDASTRPLHLDHPMLASTRPCLLSILKCSRFLAAGGRYDWQVAAERYFSQIWQFERWHKRYQEPSVLQEP